MNWKDWLRTLLGVSVLLGIAEMLLPPGSMAKFSRLVLGLTLMLAVLQPIGNLFSLNPVKADLYWTPGGISELEISSNAARVRLAGARSALRADDGILVAQVESLLLSETEITEVKIKVGTGYSGTAASVLIEPFNLRLKGQVQNMVSGILDLQAEQIDVRELRR